MIEIRRHDDTGLETIEVKITTYRKLDMSDVETDQT